MNSTKQGLSIQLLPVLVNTAPLLLYGENGPVEKSL